MYACVCDWLGFPYREEVQWVSTYLMLRAVLTKYTKNGRRQVRMGPQRLTASVGPELSLATAFFIRCYAWVCRKQSC